jgi:hypothetical protein
MHVSEMPIVYLHRLIAQWEACLQQSAPLRPGRALRKAVPLAQPIRMPRIATAEGA